MTQTEILVTGLCLLGIGLILLGHRRLDRLERQLAVRDAELIVEREAWLIEHGWERLDD